MASSPETDQAAAPQDFQAPLATVDGVNTVEIRVTIRPDQQWREARTRQLHEDAADVRVLYFYDTPALELFEAGVVLRARLREGDDDDSTVKMRCVDPDSIDASWKLFEGFRLEADCVGDETVLCASLTVLQKRDEIEDVADGKWPIDKLFSREQERFLRQFYSGGIDFGNLLVLGPIRVLCWRVHHADFPHELAVEEWRLPDGDDLVEVSIRAPAAQAAAARREFEVKLDALGLEPQGNQEAKTRAALTFFTRG